MTSTRRDRPVIGLSLDSEAPGGYSKFPWYALRQNYFSAVAAAGGLPIALPHEPGLAQHYLTLIDGLIVTGGAFDVDPALFGADSRHPSVTTKDKRTAFELTICREAHRADLPSLGICGGEQLMNVALGGTLIQHIPDEIPNALAHEQPNPRDQAGHAVEITSGTRLAAIVPTRTMKVNSAHHQAVKTVPAGLTINAVAPDGVIEGIEDAGRRYFIGVQWHPEFSIDPGDAKLFTALIEACRR